MQTASATRNQNLTWKIVKFDHVNTDTADKLYECIDYDSFPLSPPPLIFCRVCSPAPH